ncbi:hypothetical protein AWJ20_3665 [Sugiyamaella lignohabitans]|uniref:Zn(2)-C6 fungal-type domain-containing protein n=1 Tax=Sugiyamaella lignohabitans TaxID=796027 RepID=A0A170QZJ2_9ASCO|nr:uncharacterized protein AWJ20_3665 [Sugiyamaella lignohabitans]ANB16014.1 hypothetical protein AWJ20_3665 [Sugiyamaella lignohabitans]
MSVMCAVRPNTETSGKEKKKVHRHRTGCWTCRKRGYKCDEGKPECQNCLRMKISCEGYGIRLKWPGEKERSKSIEEHPLEHNQEFSPSPIPENVSDNSNGYPVLQIELLSESEAAAELVPGISSSYQHVLKLETSPRISASGPLSDASLNSVKLESPPTMSPSPFIPQSNYYPNPFTEESFPTQFSYSSVHSHDSFHPQTQTLLPVPTNVTELTAMESMENRLLTHFSTTVAEQLSPLETSAINVYRDIMIPFTSDSVKYAICAVSAANIATTSTTEMDYSEVAVQYKVAAIKDLREKLASRNGYFDQDDLSTSLLLATLEAMEGNFTSWQNHISGAIRGVFSMDKTGPEVHELMNLMEYHDAVSSILSPAGPLLAQTGDEKYQSSNILLRGIDNTSFSSVVSSLYRIVSTISTLACTATTFVGPTSASAGPFNIPNDSLWTQSMLNNRMDIFLFLDLWTVSPLNMTADAYNATMVLKHCLSLYCYTRLDSRQLGAELSAEVLAILSQASYHLQQISPSNGINSILIWPLWQMGILADSPADQFDILDRLDQIRLTLRKPAVHTVTTFLTTFWERRRGSLYTRATRRSDLNAVTNSVSPVIFF